MKTTRAAVAAALCVVVMAGCSHTQSGTPRAGGGLPSTSAQLSAFIARGIRSLRSLEVSLSVTTSRRSLTAFGQEVVRNGVVTDVALTETIPDFGALSLVIKDGVYYARLPLTQRTSEKDWVLVRPDSSSSVVRSIYAPLHKSVRTAALSLGVLFARATTRLRFLGHQRLDATATSHYALAVALRRLPRAYPDRDALIAAGVSSMPAEVWVDGRGRPRLITDQIAVHGVTIDTEVRLRQFDAPVSVKAPPRARIATD